MKKETLEDVKLVFAMIVLCSCLFGFGLLARQDTVESRALELDRKECYSWQDIEMVVFGEIQE